MVRADPCDGVEELDDQVSEAEYERLLYDEEAWRERDESFINSVDFDEKLGGVPAWPQGPRYGPGPGGRNLLQLTDQITVRGPIPSADQIGCRVVRGQGGPANTEEPCILRPKRLVALGEFRRRRKLHLHGRARQFWAWCRVGICPRAIDIQAAAPFSLAAVRGVRVDRRFDGLR